MSALGELGLDADADERAVRRAYAQRLKTTRPEDDAEAYQRLRQTYDAALAEIRWRVAERGRTEAQEVAGDPEDRVPGEAEPKPAAKADEIISDPEDAAEAGPTQPEMVLNLGIFLPDLLEQAKTLDSAKFRAWLAHILNAWPLIAMAAVSGHVLSAINGSRDPISSDNLRVISDLFGWAESLNLIDPSALMEFERRLAERERYERGLMVRELLQYRNRDALCAHMSGPWRGGYSPLTTRIYARFLTSPFPRLTAWVIRNTPILGIAVRNFIAHIDSGDTAILEAAIDKKALSIWLAPRQDWRGQFSLIFLKSPAAYGWIFLATLSAISTVFHAEGKRPPFVRSDELTVEEFLTDVFETNLAVARKRRKSGLLEDAKTLYTEIISWKPTSSNLIGTRAKVRAYFSRAEIWRAQHKFDEARNDYRQIREQYFHHNDSQIGQYVIDSLVNEALLLFDMQLYKEAEIVADRLVVDKAQAFSGDTFEKFGSALEIKISSAHQLNDSDHFRKECAAIISRYGSVPHAVIRTQVNRARDILRTLPENSDQP